MSSSKRLLTVAAGVIAVIVLGYVAAAKVWGYPLPGFAAGGERPLRSCIVSLGQFTTNLDDPGRFIKVSVDIEVDTTRAQEISDKLSELKTDIYALLRSKRYGDLMGENGLRGLQSAMHEMLLRKCPEAVLNVFFLEFLIQ